MRLNPGYMMKIKKTIIKAARIVGAYLGYDIVKRSENQLDIVMSHDNLRIYMRVQQYTMTSAERVNALIDSVRYIIKHRIQGAFVECGVWRGGSAMAIALTLNELGVKDRDIYLFDTYAGMTSPSSSDVSAAGANAQEIFDTMKFSDEASAWCNSPLVEVENNLKATGYPRERMHFIVGKVEDTLPSNAPENIALLRLDTDWYESTKHELEHLYPLLTERGILIIDDYGHWQGSKKAVDEYIAEHELHVFLSRIDNTARLAIKL